MKKLKVKFEFLWYVLWIGVYYDQKKKMLCICLLPTLVIKVWKE